MSGYERMNDCERGRRLIERGRVDSRNQSDQLAMIALWRQQREYVAMHGRCERGCDASQLHTNRIGRVLCKWTMRPCVQQELGPVVELWSIINGESDGRSISSSGQA